MLQLVFEITNKFQIVLHTFWPPSLGNVDPMDMKFGMWA